MRVRTEPWIRAERGAATVFGLALIAVLVSFAMLCAAAASLIGTHRRAEAAADLAALAAAQAVADGNDGCGAAATIARANDANLGSCQVEGANVVVTVSVPSARVFGAGLSLPARARAGSGT